MTESFIVDAVRAWFGILGSIPFVSCQLPRIRLRARVTAAPAESRGSCYGWVTFT